MTAAEATVVRARGAGLQATPQAGWSASTAALALALVVALVSVCEAGIVVLDTGATFTGMIRPEDVHEDALTIRFGPPDPGHLELPRRRVRWFDLEADRPTDAYFARFADLPLDPRWAGLREAWRRRQRGEDPGVPLPPIDWVELDPLGPVVHGPGFSLRPPRGFEATFERGVLVLVARDAPAHGYAPRIHVVVADGVDAPAGEQWAWVRDEVAGLAGLELTVEEQGVVRPAEGGADLVAVTRTRLPGREVRTLRRFAWRGARTIALAAYADARDFDALEPALRRSQATLRAVD